MTDTKELLQKIAALRMRLNSGSEPTAAASATTTAQDPMRAIEDKVHRGAIHNTLIENSLRSAEPQAATPEVPTSLRLTGRGARILRQGRDLLAALRKIADDPAYQEAEQADGLREVYHEATAMIEVLLRTAQTFPPAVSVQLRMCDGLEVVVREIEQRIAMLSGSLEQRKRTSGRINELAEFLRGLAVKKAAGLSPLQGLAEVILEEAKAGLPLAFLYASPSDPARSAAAHSLTVAHVMARLLLDDPQWQSQIELALMAALVHDVGMVRVPPGVLLTNGPLDDDQRRLIEKHTTVAEAMLSNLWPGGGWPIEAARDHHERNDGTGYPLGRRDIQLSAYVHLLAVCDVYAALCAPRPHRPAFDTRTALTEMLTLAENEYLDKPSAERLLLLSFYPVGSVVELNDGAVGLVIATHPGSVGMTNPAKPIVHLALDPAGQPLPWPSVVDLVEHKDRSILRALSAEERRTLLGKQYPQLT